MESVWNSDASLLEASDEFLDAIRCGVCVCDRNGLILRFNARAADYWGRKPNLRDAAERFCGAYGLYSADGERIPRSERPTATVLETGRAILDREFIIERLDGTRIAVLISAEPVRNKTGRVIGAVSCFWELRAAKASSNEEAGSEDYATRLAAIVECSDDAIVSKDINGIITSWNTGAEQLFGYSAEEAIGQPVTLLIPPDRLDEEVSILERIRRGEKVRHYETVRQRKDGARLDVWLAVSPIRNAKGEIIGASKIARDITERRRAQERQMLLLREMNHRIKNLFALAGSVVTISARFARSADELVETVQERLGALARAHDLTLPDLTPGADRSEKQTTLRELTEAILSPYDDRDGGRRRFSLAGPDLSIAGGSLTTFALLLHEFATNAVKYGALSATDGQIDIEWRVDGGDLHIDWTESGGPAVKTHGEIEGFGSSLAHAAVTSQLGGRLSREWNPDGLAIRLVVPLKGFITV